LKRKLTKHQFEVQFHLIQVFSSIDIEKKFLIQEFFQNYQSRLSNQEKTNMKKYFIQLIQFLNESSLIESNYKIISNNKIYLTNQLTTNNISEGFMIYEKLVF